MCAEQRGHLTPPCEGRRNQHSSRQDRHVPCPQRPPGPGRGATRVPHVSALGLSSRRTTYCVIVLGTGCLKSRCRWGRAPLEPVGKNPSLPPGFWWQLAILGQHRSPGWQLSLDPCPWPCLHAPRGLPASLPVHTAASLCAFFSRRSASHMTLGSARLQGHLSLIRLVTSAVTLFLHKVTFRGPGS